MVRLNFDGAARRGKVTVRGVLRDEKGNVLVAYLGKLGMGTNNEAEAMALLWGLKIVVEMRIKKLSIEGDSKLTIDVVKGRTQPGWAL